MLSAEPNPDEIRENKILEVIMSYARLDFSPKTIISDKCDVVDAIGAGVNMLGEELKSSVISLREKEQLLREIHHRVKNNMQIISSLLNLQASYTKDKKTLTLLKENRDRIKSMALVHELLYSTNNLSKIKLADYIRVLCESIYESYCMPDMEVDFQIQIPQTIFFEIDKMIHLGMVLNEIISNSLKYAFDNSGGTISITMKQTESSHTLTIADNGKGLPTGYDRERDGSLGTQLIYMLTEQINGTVSIKNKKGVSYLIEF